MPAASLARQAFSRASGGDDNSETSIMSFDAGVYKIGGYAGLSATNQHFINPNTTLNYTVRAGGTAGFSKNATGFYAGGAARIDHISENGAVNHISAMVDGHTAAGVRADVRIGTSRELDGQGLKPNHVKIEAVGQLYKGEASAYVLGTASKELSQEHRLSGHFAAAGGMVDGEEFLAAEVELRRGFDCPKTLRTVLKECSVGAGVTYNSQGNNQGVDLSGRGVVVQTAGQVSPFVAFRAGF